MLCAISIVTLFSISELGLITAEYWEALVVEKEVTVPFATVISSEANPVTSSLNSIAIEKLVLTGPGVDGVIVIVGDKNIILDHINKFEKVDVYDTKGIFQYTLQMTTGDNKWS